MYISLIHGKFVYSKMSIIHFYFVFYKLAIYIACFSAVLKSQILPSLSLTFRVQFVRDIPESSYCLIPSSEVCVRLDEREVEVMMLVRLYRHLGEDGFFKLPMAIANRS